MLYEEGFTQNREISWLRYNERVLEEALDEGVPLFERLRFIGIFVSNLEEFFKVRVGSLLYDDNEGSDKIDTKSGMTAAEQLRRIHSMIPGLLMKKDMAYSEVEARLAEAGVERLEAYMLSEVERGLCFDFFRDRIKENLKVSVLDEDEKLPEMDEDRPYLIAMLDAELEDKFGFVDIPRSLPEFMELPEEVPQTRQSDDNKVTVKFRYILTEDIIKMFADILFVPFLPLEVHMIDIARNDEAAGSAGRANTAKEMREIIRRRKNAPADKLISDGAIGRRLKDYLMDALGLDRRQIFTTSRIDFSYIEELSESIPDGLKQSLMYEPHTPYDQTKDIKGSVIDEVKKRDLLSAYPYDSMDILLSLLREASFAPDVREIRLTVYRLASHPRISEYLIYAARHGKRVNVVFELRARFDEERNLEWADRLSAAGCKVYFGADRFKVHSKMCQIVLDTPEKKKDGKSAGRTYITQISTGNYNEKTAKMYTDFSLVTYSQTIGAAASDLFKDICRESIASGKISGAEREKYYPLLVSPLNMRKTILQMIRRESEKGSAGLIFLKMNSLTDDEIIEALMEASCAGCQVRLIVRGVCCLLPGVSSCTENICIVNVVGRFLEHSRVYIFGEGDEELMFISSADMMARNLDRRVEVACPVSDSKIKDRIRDLMYLSYMDSEKGRMMLPDGSYALKPVPAQ